MAGVIKMEWWIPLIAAVTWTLLLLRDVQRRPLTGWGDLLTELLGAWVGSFSLYIGAHLITTKVIAPLIKTWVVPSLQVVLGVELGWFALFFTIFSLLWRKLGKTTEEKMEAECRAVAKLWKNAEEYIGRMWECLEELKKKTNRQKNEQRTGHQEILQLFRELNNRLQNLADQIAELPKKASIVGERVRVEGLEFQGWSAQLFRNFGFDVENKEGLGEPDHILRLGGRIKCVVAAKNWRITNQNWTVNEERIRPELKLARTRKVPLVVHVRNKENNRNFFHIFRADGLTGECKVTTPDWLRRGDLSEGDRQKMMENYRRFHRFVDEITR